MKKFKTIQDNVTIEIEEKRSRFIANIFYVENVEQAENIIKEIKKKYYDARHNCYAYIINDEQVIKKSSDDGEPSGTAGSPILNVIEKNALGNVLIIVTRYFGGILLGAGGLVRAYTESATKVIRDAIIVEQEQGYELEVTISYQDMEKLKYYCNQNNIKIIKNEYGENIKCKMEVTEEEKNSILDDKYNDKMANILKFEIISEKNIRK